MGKRSKKLEKIKHNMSDIVIIALLGILINANT